MTYRVCPALRLLSPSLLFCSLLALALAGNAHAASELATKALPLGVFEKLMVSPEAGNIKPGDTVKELALDDTHTMKLVVHAPAAPQTVIQVALPEAGTDAYATLAKAVEDARATGVPTKIVLAPGVDLTSEK